MKLQEGRKNLCLEPNEKGIQEHEPAGHRRGTHCIRADLSSLLHIIPNAGTSEIQMKAECN